MATETQGADWRTLNAGRELDAAVAERVMGWTRTHETHRLHGRTYLRGAAPATGRLQAVPAYSTDIAAAWLVVEKLREHGWFPSVQAQEECGQLGGRWLCEVDPRFSFIDGDGSTAPLAVCRAALAAMETAR